MPDTFRDLQVDEQFEFQQGYWRFQRVAWAILVLILFAALAGLLGPGPLSSAGLTTADDRLEVRYVRFGRYQTPQSIEFRFLGGEGQPTVWLSRELVSAVTVNSVHPEPEASLIDEAGVTYRFSAASVRAGGASPPVLFEVTPGRPGLIQGSLGATRRDAAPIWQFVYP